MGQSSVIDWKEAEKVVKKQARKFKRKGLEVEDLEQEARLAVLEHWERYDPKSEVSRQTFLASRVHDALEKYLHRNASEAPMESEWTSEHISGDPEKAIHATSRQACRAEAKLRGKTQYREPVPAAVPVVSLEGPGDDGEHSLHECVGEEGSQETETLLRACLAKLEGLPGLREIVELKLQDLSFLEIGKRLGKSEIQVYRMWQEAVNHMRGVCRQ